MADSNTAAAVWINLGNLQAARGKTRDHQAGRRSRRAEDDRSGGPAGAAVAIALLP